MAETETISLSRELYVPRELVFDVWTQPEHLAEWYSPGPEFERAASVDLRVGGDYQLRWRSREGAEHRQWGRYETVQPPSRLSYSARTESAELAPLNTRVAVSFADLDGGTRIDLAEEGVPASACAPRRRDWQRLLDQLESYFSAI